jgi:hypothetical protein
MIKDTMKCIRDFKSDDFGKLFVLYRDCVVGWFWINGVKEKSTHFVGTSEFMFCSCNLGY